VTTWFLAIVVAGQISFSSAADDQLPTVPRETAAIRREVSDLLRAESAAAADAERGRHVRRMTQVYLEIVGDERFVDSPTLQQQRIKLWTRLIRIRDELKRRQSIEQRSRSSDDEQGQRELAEALSAHLQLASQTLGGPSAVFAGAAGGGAVVDDFGDELIDLITNTIHPSHWNTNGGPGSIVYFRPALALVVRASSEVHSDVRNVVGALRDAGK